MDEAVAKQEREDEITKDLLEEKARKEQERQNDSKEEYINVKDLHLNPNDVGFEH